MAQHLPEPVDPAAFANLEPDFILPEQFFPEQQPNWSGELSLLWTVFSDGIETFRKEILLGRELAGCVDPRLLHVGALDAHVHQAGVKPLVGEQGPDGKRARRTSVI